MAIGIGKILGFEFKPNFNYPYISRSITDFWRRWHISLSSWFRDYLYIPLGGNRMGMKRQLFNILIVWAATGIWHGASFNFLAWGLYYAIILMLEKLVLLKVLDKTPRILRHIYALIFIAIGWAIFGMADMSDGAGYFKALFGITGVTNICETGDLFQLSNNALLLMVLVFASLPIGKRLFDRLSDGYRNVAEIVLIVTGLVMSTAYLVDSTYNPFLYFRF